MPELPEVETVCRGLNQVTLGKMIRGGEVFLEKTLAYPLSVSEFCDRLAGVAIAHWQRRGKYLLAQLVTPDKELAGWLGFHLRMTGQLLWVEQAEALPKHTRVRLFFEGNRELRFVDIRTFGRIWRVPPTEAPETRITGLQKLGVEPFSADFSLDYFAQQLKKSQRSIKAVLLDQAIIAGLGNIYADEALFKSGIRPTAIARELRREQLECLRHAILEILQTAIERGGTTFSNFLNVEGINGNYGGVAWVYGRDRKPCRLCATPIERLKLGGRSTHYCPQCQR
jgi:formamidopyrimidine-DNA glycosylase